MIFTLIFWVLFFATNNTHAYKCSNGGDISKKYCLAHMLYISVLIRSNCWTPFKWWSSLSIGRNGMSSTIQATMGISPTLWCGEELYNGSYKQLWLCCKESKRLRLHIFALMRTIPTYWVEGFLVRMNYLKCWADLCDILDVWLSLGGGPAIVEHLDCRSIL